MIYHFQVVKTKQTKERFYITFDNNISFNTANVMLSMVGISNIDSSYLMMNETITYSVARKGKQNEHTR